MTDYQWQAGSGLWSNASNWSPDGVPESADDAQIAAAGDYSVGLDVAAIGSVSLDAAGATLTAAGQTALTGTLALDAGTLALSGMLSGGVISQQGGSLQSQNGTLSGVSIVGTLTDDASSSRLTIDGGFGGTPDAPVGLVFSHSLSELTLNDGLPIEDSTISIGLNSADYNNVTSLDGSFTLGASSVLNLLGANALQGTVVNDGLIDAGSPEGELGGVSFQLPGTVENNGTISVHDHDGVFVADNAFINNGVIAVSEGAGFTVAAGEAEDYGGLQNPGVIEISSGGSVTVTNGGRNLGDIRFEDGTGRLDILEDEDQAGGISATIDGFRPGDILADRFGATLTHSGNTLVLTNGGVNGFFLPVTFQLTGGDYSDAVFALDDGQITETEVPCFARGVRILTARGEVAVEALAVGDRVVTLSGRGAPLKPVRWIGRRRVDCARSPSPANVIPIRIATDAFGPGLPHRDLIVSPGHAIVWEGALYPAAALLNGATVRRHQVDAIEYFHVELDGHDVMLAEGLPAESYLDTGNRDDFDAGAGVVTLHPDLARHPGARAPVLPVVEQGERLVAVHRHLIDAARRLGYAPAEEHGLVVRADGRRLAVVASGDLVSVALPTDWQRLMIETDAGRPCALAASGDWRELGLKVEAVSFLADGGWSDIALVDPCLRDGFHAVEHDAAREFRWTSGLATVVRGGLSATAMRLRLGGRMTGWRLTSADRVGPPWPGGESRSGGEGGVRSRKRDAFSFC